MLISYDHPAYDLHGRYELDSSRAEFWFPHPVVDTRRDRDWQRHERLVINNLPSLLLTDPIALVKTDVVDVVMYGTGVPEHDKLDEEFEDRGALAIIKGELELPNGSHLVENAPPNLTLEGVGEGIVLPPEVQLRIHAAQNSIKRCAGYIRNIYALPALIS